MAVGHGPASDRFLGDLRLVGDLRPSHGAVVRIPVVPELCDAAGGVRAGVMATLVDVVGGVAAARGMHPRRTATADLAIEIVEPAIGPFVEARSTTLRVGSTTFVIEASVFDVDPAGGTPDRQVAWATMTFAVLDRPAPGENPPAWRDPPSHWTTTGSGFAVPVDDALGITVVDPARGMASLPVGQYVRNSFGAAQGGVLALLAEIAAEEAIACRVGAEPTVTDLHMAYLSLGRAGPIVSRATVLGDRSRRRDSSAAHSRHSAVVELRDRGGAGRMTTLVTVGASVGEGQNAMAIEPTTSSPVSP